ncbi:hypothetical protein EF879_25975 [Micromonospora sp. HM5-17]|nr:hypothetical protein EF879_25975 [Micromonospora sp. HM5-17]
MSEGEFRAKLTKMEKLNNDVSKNCTTLFSRCNRAISILPPPLAQKLNNALNKLNELIKKFFEEIAKIFLNPGWPFGLMSAGNDWTAKVGGPATQQAAKINEEQMRIDNHWQGPAAEAYSKVLPSQKDALNAIKTATDAIDSNLQKTAYGIFGLWAAIVIAVAMFVAELTAETAAAATVVGAPPAAAGAGASTAKVVGLITAIVAAFVAYVGTLVDSLTSLRQTLASSAAFPGGKWPKSTTSDFSDGSISDGDTTDWRIKTND